MKLWSHMAAQRDVDDDSPEAVDEREALNLRYGGKVVLVLPLSSGRFAFFGADRQLYEIVDEINPATIRQLAETKNTEFSHARMLREAGLAEPSDREFGHDLTVARSAREGTGSRPKKPSTIEISLDDIEL